MQKHVDGKVLNAIGILVRAGTALEIMIAFLIVLPLTLWFAWARHSTAAEPVVLTLFCLSFAWGNISLLRWRRNMRKLGWSSPRTLSFGMSPRPEDPSELDTWQRGRHLCLSFVAVLICMFAFGVIKWLNGDY